MSKYPTNLPEPAEERLLTRPVAAKMLCLCPQTLALWSMTGKHLPVVRVGERAVRYKVSDIQKLIEKGLTPASD